MALEDFENSPRGGIRCLTCALPSEVRGEMREGRAKGKSFTTIHRWLSAEHGAEIGVEALAAHFRKGHDNVAR